MLNGLLGINRTYVTVPQPVTPTRTAETEQIAHRLDALELACSGMWMLLKTKHGYTDEELTQAIHAVDARDGVVDGKMTPPQAVCPACGRHALTRQRSRCLWCGAEMTSAPL
jgi:hypothetical protein